MRPATRLALACAAICVGAAVTLAAVEDAAGTPPDVPRRTISRSVACEVVAPAEPGDVEGPVIVRVVHLGGGVAHLAAAPLELAPPQVDASVGTGVVLGPLGGGERVRLAPLAHVRSVAALARPGVGSPWLAALAESVCGGAGHGPSLPSPLGPSPEGWSVETALGTAAARIEAAARIDAEVDRRLVEQRLAEIAAERQAALPSNLIHHSNVVFADSWAQIALLIDERSISG